MRWWSIGECHSTAVEKGGKKELRPVNFNSEKSLEEIIKGIICKCTDDSKEMNSSQDKLSQTNLHDKETGVIDRGEVTEIL